MADLPYAVRAEVRAVEEGHRAFDNGDGTFRVVSDTREGVAYTVRPVLGSTPKAMCLISCDCPAGRNARNRTCPCKHAALVGRRLEREGKLRFDTGLDFWVTPGTPPEPTKEEIDALFDRFSSPSGDLLF